MGSGETTWGEGKEVKEVDRGRFPKDGVIYLRNLSECQVQASPTRLRDAFMITPNGSLDAMTCTVVFLTVRCRRFAGLGTYSAEKTTLLSVGKVIGGIHVTSMDFIPDRSWIQKDTTS